MEPSPSQTQSPTPKSGVLVALDELDKWVSVKVHEIGRRIPRSTLRALEHSGDGRFCIPITAAIWVTPVLFKFPELRSFLLNLFVAFMFDLVFIGTLKSIIRRPRPVYNKGMYVFVSVDHWSFPSGHASRALMVAAFFWFYEPMWGVLCTEHLVPTAKPYLDQLYPGSGMVLSSLKALVAPAALYLLSMWAVATASSRVLLGRHYVMDVMAGSAIGLLEASFLHSFLHISPSVSQSLHSWLLAKLGIPNLQ
ncbi:presqualene diphosphate phosphatase [Marchantia polymorpha subsp. ruderalis]|nr:hypothetical protein MARPO_0056s0139 [Marchantia polymorpha]BBN15014.1 hypothetical protein Mp_6g16290 [Marchantia polymorpha subsp. ruderalis]|eukprot:PTQ37698.1 hypothetical protein MARPO_0056s0139 [Marchantia polymorpha]